LSVRRFVWYQGPVILYCLLIFIQSAQPSVLSAGPSFPHMDKLAHFLGYALLGRLFFRAYDAAKPGWNMRTLVMAAGLSAALYGVCDELHQAFVPWRTADILDLCADTLGGFAGSWAGKRSGRIPG